MYWKILIHLHSFMMADITCTCKKELILTGVFCTVGGTLVRSVLTLFEKYFHVVELSYF
jgi:hypothetical protein